MDPEEDVAAFLKRMVPTEAHHLLMGDQNTKASYSHDNPFSSLIIVMDEGQITYTDRVWWNTLKEVIFGWSSAKFVVFVSHGSKSPVQTLASTDFQLGPKQVIGIGHHTDSDLSLFFTQEEYRNAMRGLQEGLHWRLDPEAEDYIYSLTLGHPGASHAVLHYLQSVRSNQICQTRHIG